MNSIFNFIFESAANLTEVGLFFYLIWHQLMPKSRYKDKMSYIVPVSVISMFSVAALLNALRLNGTVGTIIFFTMQISFTFLILSGSIAECFFWPVYFILSDLAAEGLSFLVAGGFTATGPNGLMYQYPQRYVLVTSYILILSLFTIIIVRISNKKMKLPNMIIFVLTFMAVVALVYVGILLDMSIRMNLQPNDFPLRLTYSVMVIILCFIAFMVLFLMFAGRTYQDNIELATNYAMKEQKYEELKHLLISMKETVDYEIIEDRSPCVINLKEVKYFESVGKIVYVHMRNGDMHNFYKTKGMNKLYQEINSLYPPLVPLNISYMADINIVELENRMAHFDGKQTRVSDKYMTNLKEIREFKCLSLPL